VTLELEDLVITANDGRRILGPVSARTESGEALLVTGPGGSGKSALLMAVCGLIPSLVPGRVTGRTILDGKDLTPLGPAERGRTMGLVFQDCRAQFFMPRVADELLFTVDNYGMDRRAVEERFRRTVGTMTLEKFLGRSVFGLSSGERQRLAIAEVAVYGPRVVLMDDPEANLDAEGRGRLKTLIGDLLKEGRIVLVAANSGDWPQDMFVGRLSLGDDMTEPGRGVPGPPVSSDQGALGRLACFRSCRDPAPDAPAFRDRTRRPGAGARGRPPAIELRGMKAVRS
jgi:energy-coupling factor transport system ATP-binding protein